MVGALGVTRVAANHGDGDGGGGGDDVNVDDVVNGDGDGDGDGGRSLWKKSPYQVNLR